MKKRGISYDDLVFAFANGEIIKQYEDDKPHPSCLIFGHTANKQPLHVVASISNNMIWVITAYHPTLHVWESDYKTRKAVK
jgi:hypothetical protein